MRLSDEQFAGTINSTGGATRHWDTKEEPPKRGYMISLPGHEAIHPGDVSTGQVSEHYKEHDPAARRLLASGQQVYHGGWQEPHPDTRVPSSFLDISTHHDAPWHEVRSIGEERGQLGAFHLPTLGSTYETNKMFRQMPSHQADEAWASKPDRPSKYERESTAVPELGETPTPRETIGRSTGVLNGKQIPLEHVMRTIAAGRMARAGHGR